MTKVNRDYNPYNKDTMSLKEAIGIIKSLGYEVSKSDTFNYTLQGIKRRAYYLVDSETKLGAFNVNSRRDERYNKLQELRYWITVKHGEKVCEF